MLIVSQCVQFAINTFVKIANFKIPRLSESDKNQAIGILCGIASDSEKGYPTYPRIYWIKKEIKTGYGNGNER